MTPPSNSADLRAHHLLAPERRFAAFILRRQQSHRTPTIVRLEQNYGPVGIALMAATLMSGISGAVAAWTGIIILFLSNGSHDLLVAFYCLLFITLLLEFIAIARAIQGIYIGRTFRGDRPFVKRT